MITLHGIPASPGVAIGPAWLYQKVQLAAYEELSRLTAQAEQRRFDCAVQEARAQLDRLYEKTVREAGEAAAQIFDIHKMMMEDLDYLESVEDNITNQLYTAEHAVACAGQEFAEMFASMDDEVMRARSADIRDITQRLLQVLTGGQSQALKESSVVCAHDLFPSDTMQLEREHVMAFVTELGSHVSHSAILARTMGIPAVVGVGGLVEALSAASGTVVVDGSQGLVILDADEQTLADYSARRQAYLREQTDLQVYRDLPSRTKDGLELEICANIAYVTDADNAAAVRADGVGLMRSEFLYMNADSAPDEDTQFAAYRAVLEKLEGKRVVVRTLDIGADKVPPWLPLPPALYASSSADGHGSNDGDYKSAEFDELLNAALAQTDVKKRTEDFTKAQEVLAKDLPVIPLWNDNVAAASATNVKNVSFDYTNLPTYNTITK